MRLAIVLLLLVFWLFLAVRALGRGDTDMAGLFAVILGSMSAFQSFSGDVEM